MLRVKLRHRCHYIFSFCRNNNDTIFTTNKTIETKGETNCVSRVCERYRTYIEVSVRKIPIIVRAKIKNRLSEVEEVPEVVVSDCSSVRTGYSGLAAKKKVQKKYKNH